MPAGLSFYLYAAPLSQDETHLETILEIVLDVATKEKNVDRY